MNFLFLLFGIRTTGFLISLEVVNSLSGVFATLDVHRSYSKLTLLNILLSFEFLLFFYLIVVNNLRNGKLDRRFNLDNFLFGLFFWFVNLLLLFRFFFLEFGKFGFHFTITGIGTEQILHFLERKSSQKDSCYGKDNPDNGTELTAALIGTQTISAVFLVTSLKNQVTPIFGGQINF